MKRSWIFFGAQETFLGVVIARGPANARRATPKVVVSTAWAGHRHFRLLSTQHPLSFHGVGPPVESGFQPFRMFHHT